MKDRLIELEVLQKAIVEAIEAYDKMQTDLVKARKSLTKILSKDIATLLEMIERSELNRSLLAFLDNNITSSNRSNQKEAATFMEELRSAMLKYMTDFIKVSCKAARYPALCVECLSRYASEIQQNEQHLALTALSVSLARARSAAAYVNKLTKVRGIKHIEFQAVKDCVENMGDSVDRLNSSIRELGHMGRTVHQDFLWHMSNVQTWVSAALTDENTCLDGFAGHRMDGNVKAAIKRRVIYVAQVTSNALALINRFAARHHAVASGEEP